MLQNVLNPNQQTTSWVNPSRIVGYWQKRGKTKHPRMIEITGISEIEDFEGGNTTIFSPAGNVTFGEKFRNLKVRDVVVNTVWVGWSSWTVYLEADTGETFWMFLSPSQVEDAFGIHCEFKRNLRWNPLYQQQPDHIQVWVQIKSGTNTKFDFHVKSAHYTYLRLAESLGPKSLRSLDKMFVENKWLSMPDDVEKPGITKVYKAKIQKLAQKLVQNEEYLAAVKLSELLKMSSQTLAGVKISKILNEELEKINTLQELRNFANSYDNTKTFWERFDCYQQMRKGVVKKNVSAAHTKIFNELEEMPFTQESHPRLFKCVLEGRIPLRTFFPKEAKEAYFLINSHWDLWEEMLENYEEVACELARTVSQRTHYAKDLMSYFYFVLYALPEYLERHTGGKWTCSPIIVNSEDELSPEAPDASRGVTKSRSALTPIVDNEARHVVVPYVSLQMSGVHTTYCYAHSFHVLQRGMMFDGNVVTKELEQCNGRDDYGLMFYTLTGSYTARGYPTFLIIFERLGEGKTKVHFHRTHPMRSKDGDTNPVNNWINVCYNWMVGNVPKGQIAFQQGDLAFIRLTEDQQSKIDFSSADLVSTYDSHNFATPVKFQPYEGKTKHVLGHVYLDGNNTLQHPEHMDVPLQETGLFEVRQCRSWEANPRGVWTLNID